MKGYVELHALPQISTDNVVIDTSECQKLREIPIPDDLTSLELDAFICNCDGVFNFEGYPVDSSGSLPTSLKLTCQRFRELRYRDSDRHDQFSMLGGIRSQDIVRFLLTPIDGNYFGLLDGEEWFERGLRHLSKPSFFSILRKNLLTMYSFLWDLFWILTLDFIS